MTQHRAHEDPLAVDPRTIIAERQSTGAGWVVASALVAALFVGIYLLAGMTRTDPTRTDAIAATVDAQPGPAPHAAPVTATRIN